MNRPAAPPPPAPSAPSPPASPASSASPASPSASPTPSPKPPPRRLRLDDLLAVTALLLLAGAAHGAVFGNAGGYIAAGGGVGLGLLVAAAGARWRWNAVETLIGSVVVYLAFGGALALPTTTAHRVLPTIATLQGLVIGAVESWKDLLTLAPPAGAFVGPTIVPLLSGLLCSVAALTIALRARTPAWALVPVLALAASGIAWGSQNAPLARYLGAALAAGCVLWGARLAARRRRGAATGIVGAPARRRAVGVAGGAGMIAAALALAVAAAPALQGAGHRDVLRDHVDPPLDITEYASPLTSYQYWMDDQKDTVLFTVTGLAEGQRIRLATLDTYDGVVMRVGADADGEGFVRDGATVTDTPPAPGETTTTLGVTIDGYTGYWIPGGGDLRSVRVADGDRAVADTLYYSSQLQTALTTRGLTRGDSYTVTATTVRTWTDAQLSDKPFSRITLPTDTAVPEEVGARLPEFIAGADGGVETVRALTQALTTLGYYSDGTDGQSLSGHSAWRISRFLDPDALMVGDDEQYAVAMALMLRHAGCPARVVVGFYPEQYTGGAQQITGTDAHAWVEVGFEGAGWVAFDPTPPRDKIPQTEIPKPKPNPRPQVIQPPVPPQDPADLAPDIDDDDQDERNEPSRWLSWLLLALKILGGALIVLAPFILVVVIKALRRRRRRRAAEPLDRVIGSWDELVDRATDLRLEVPLAAARDEQARIMSAPGPQGPAPRVFGARAQVGGIEALARMVDGSVFGGGRIAPETADAAWAGSGRALAELGGRATRRRRLRASISLTSLRRRRAQARAASRHSRAAVRAGRRQSAARAARTRGEQR